MAGGPAVPSVAGSECQVSQATSAACFASSPSSPPHVTRTDAAHASLATIAQLTGKSYDQAHRDVQRLLNLGLIRPGVQSLADHLPAGQRPVVYDVAMDVRGSKPKKASENPAERKKDTPPSAGTPGMDATPAWMPGVAWMRGYLPHGCPSTPRIYCGYAAGIGEAVAQPLPSFFVVAADPAMRALAGDAQFFGHVGDGPALDTDAPYQQDPP
jgi:hypothetical protein